MEKGICWKVNRFGYLYLCNLFSNPFFLLITCPLGIKFPRNCCHLFIKIVYFLEKGFFFTRKLSYDVFDERIWNTLKLLQIGIDTWKPWVFVMRISFLLWFNFRNPYELMSKWSRLSGILKQEVIDNFSFGQSESLKNLRQIKKNLFRVKSGENLSYI